MTVPHLSHTDFLNLLKENGWEVASDSYWEEYNRIILKKDGYSFPLQYKEVYFFPFVVKTCISLGINPPEDHTRVYQQLKNHKQKVKKDQNKPKD